MTRKKPAGQGEKPRLHQSPTASRRFRRASALFFCCAAILCSRHASFAGPSILDEWKKYSRTGESRILLAWMRCRTMAILASRECGRQIGSTAPPFFGKTGIFVTFMKGKTVRGCYGAFDHKSDSLERVLEEYIRGALACDPRHPPLDISEIGDIKIVLTLAGEQLPVDDINSVDISRYGIILTLDDNERIVYVPAEIKSMDYLKSSMRGMEIQQMAAFRAVVIKE